VTPLKNEEERKEEKTPSHPPKKTASKMESKKDSKMDGKQSENRDLSRTNNVQCLAPRKSPAKRLFRKEIK